MINHIGHKPNSRVHSHFYSCLPLLARFINKIVTRASTMLPKHIILFSFVFSFLDKVSPEIPQPFDYIGKGFGLECYECHSNRPGCGREIDWILSRWKRCDMPIPKCVKIIEKIGSQTFYVRGCLREIEVAREDIPTVRENGCWTIDGEYVGWGRNIFVKTDKTIYCFCDERDGCNSATRNKFHSLLALLFTLVLSALIY